MTTVTGTDRTDRLDAKPAWTRCGACKQRLWNDRVDIEVHRAVCPADLVRTLKRLTKTLEKLEGRVEELERRPEAHVVELESGPVLDFEHEAPWPVDPGPSVGIDLEEADVPWDAPPAPIRLPYLEDDDED